MSPGSRVRTPPGASRLVPQKPQTAGLEPARAEPSGFRVHPLNRLGTSACHWPLSSVAEHRSRKPGVESSILSVAFFFSPRPKSAGRGHAGARTQDLRLIRATLYRLSYATLWMIAERGRACAARCWVIPTTDSRRCISTASWCSGSTSDSKSDNGGSIPSEVSFCGQGEVAEWSKALRPGRSLFGGVGSNPTLTIFVEKWRCRVSIPVPLAC